MDDGVQDPLLQEENELLKRRLEKLQAWRQKGIAPYALRFDRTDSTARLHERFRDLPAGEDSGYRTSVAGRLMALRRHGKATFADIMDAEGRIQILATLDGLGDPRYEDFLMLDIGDFVGVNGVVFRSKRGELTVRVEQFSLLSKSLRPLPEKWHGLRDVELRLRRRYLDLLVNPETRERMLIRSRVVKELRRFLDERGFLEVETPMLHPIPGGAAAKPFKTYHNALGQELYLRIAPELYLKRCVVGGLEKVYELNRNFRNEGISYKHNPEFTMLEFYWAYADYNDLASFLEDMLSEVILKVKGELVFPYQGRELDFRPPWERVRLLEAVSEAVGTRLGPDTPMEDMVVLAERHGVSVEKGWGKGKVIAELFEKLVEPELWNPTLVMDYPKEVSPLAREHRDNPFLVERFELIAAGRELANAFSELIDPVDQRERFLEQLRMRERGDEEAHRLDHDFLLALEYGMPPTGGLGLGVDRLVMLLTDAHSIREVILFPHLRPEEV